MKHVYQFYELIFFQVPCFYLIEHTRRSDRVAEDRDVDMVKKIKRTGMCPQLHLRTTHLSSISDSAKTSRQKLFQLCVLCTRISTTQTLGKTLSIKRSPRGNFKIASREINRACFFVLSSKM